MVVIDSSAIGTEVGESHEMPHSTTEKTSPATALPTKTLKDNVTVPIFPLETISYELIRSGDAAEKERLLAACRYPGFFYLDFRDNNEGRKVLADLKETYRAEGEFFDEHHEKEKMKDIEVRGFLPSIAFTRRRGLQVAIAKSAHFTFFFHEPCNLSMFKSC